MPSRPALSLVLFTTIFLSHGISFAQAQITEIGSISVEGATRFHIKAKHIDEQYQIDVVAVGPKRSADSADQKLPVIYVLDGNTQFLLVSRLANLLATARAGGFGPGIRRALIVAIGYVPDPSLSDTENFNIITMRRRHRDYTPVLDSEFVKNNPGLPPHSGAPAFLSFINEELKPAIANKYPVDTDNQTIIGHSMGGLFVLYAFINSPESFDKYIASSPGLAWGDYRPLGNNLHLKDIDHDNPIKVFVSAGGEEDMIKVVNAAVMSLERNTANLKVIHKVFSDENHVSVMPNAIVKGLEAVFN